jgi:energy-coupling factor transporter transmembrane protein EcfT
MGAGAVSNESSTQPPICTGTHPQRGADALLPTEHAASAGLLASMNPAARVIALLVVSLGLLASLDLVSASVALLLAIVALFALRIRFAAVLRRTWVLLAISPLSGIATLLYGRAGGRVYFSWTWITITDYSIALASATPVRILAILLASLALAYKIDPKDLSDSLEQVLHLPSRFVLGALAALRLFDLLREDWAALAAARRSRGVGDHSRISQLLNQSFALFVLANRRAGKLATAMEARAFGGPQQRTWSHRVRLVRRDWLLMAGGALLVAISLMAAWWSGALNIVFLSS